METVDHPSGRRDGQPAVRQIRPGLTLLELLIVLAIIGTLTAMMLPALGRAYRRANDAICMNNLRQMGLALAEYRDVNKRIPPLAKTGRMGGWAIELLPFLEQGNLFSTLKPDTLLASAPQVFLAKPKVYRCPFGSNSTRTGGMEDANYLLVPSRDRKGGTLLDIPTAFEVPWAGSPELSMRDVLAKKGPHLDRFFSSHGQVLPESP